MPEAGHDLDHDGVRHFAGRIQISNQASKASLVKLGGKRDEVNKPAQGRINYALLIRSASNFINKARDLGDAELGRCLCGCIKVSRDADTRSTRLERLQLSRSESKAARPASCTDGMISRYGRFPVVEPAAADVGA